jgi:hypothetical protein
MTLQETERCRRQSARDKAMHYERRRSGGGDDAIRPDDNRVLTLAQWCALNGISLARHRSGHHATQPEAHRRYGPGQLTMASVASARCVSDGARKRQRAQPSR